MSRPSPPRSLRAVVDEVRDLTGDVREAAFRLVDPQSLEFEPGQYATVRLATRSGTVEPRAFTIASEPADRGRLLFVAKLVENGLASGFFRSLLPGAEVALEAPFGRFGLCADDRRPALFVATGTGVAPFRAMIRHLLLTQSSARPITLLFGVRAEADLFWVDAFEALARDRANFRFLPTLSRPGPTWRGRKGRVLAWIEEAAGGAQEVDAYLCGRPPMVEEAAARLESLGVDPAHVHVERFD